MIFDVVKLAMGRGKILSNLQKSMLDKGPRLCEPPPPIGVGGVSDVARQRLKLLDTKRSIVCATVGWRTVQDLLMLKRSAAR